MLIFYDWPYSPFCMKVRAILQYKKVAFQSVNPLAAFGELRRRGKTGKVPAIDLDGGMIADSTDIAYALEERFPKPSILPASEYQRGLCHVLEDWADESLYFLGLYYRWFDQDGRKPIAGVFGRSLRGRLAYAFYLRRVLSQLRGQGMLRKSREHVSSDLGRQLDAVESLVQPADYLLGDVPYLCDFALWGQLAYLRRTPVGHGAMAGRNVIHSYMDRVEAIASAPAPTGGVPG